MYYNLYSSRCLLLCHPVSLFTYDFSETISVARPAVMAHINFIYASLSITRGSQYSSSVIVQLLRIRILLVRFRLFEL